MYWVGNSFADMVVPHPMLACKLTGLLINKENYMGQVKKQYQNWCERNDKNPDDNLTGADLEEAMQDLEHQVWRKEFDDWLSSVAKRYTRDGANDE